MGAMLALAAIHYLSTWDVVGGAALGVGGIVQGINHYRGITTWLLRYVPFDSIFFLPLWMGPVFLLAVLADLSAHVSTALAWVFAVPALVLLPVALLSMFWLPDRLLPAWYLDWREHGRHFSQLPGRSVIPGQQ